MNSTSLGDSAEPTDETEFSGYLASLPKVDLHCHLDGSLRPATLVELAETQGINLGAMPPGTLAFGQSAGSLVAYLRAFDATVAVLQTAPALERVAYELGVDAANEGVTYLEVRFAPHLNTRAGLGLDAVIEAALAGLRRAQKEHGLHWALLLCGMRNASGAQTLEVAQVAHRWMAHGVAGLDLAGPEIGYPGKLHAAAFDFARSVGLRRTVHAGEAGGPESVIEAIEALSAERIGHGIRVLEDARAVELARQSGVCFEVCLSSNVHTGATASFSEHPVRRMLELGLKVTLNTDNRLVSATTMTNELRRAYFDCGLSIQQLRDVLATAETMAFRRRGHGDATVSAVVGELKAPGGAQQ